MKNQAFPWGFRGFQIGKLVVCLLLATSAARADVLSDPWPRKVADFPDSLTITKGEFRITISVPDSPELRDAGGTGGAMRAFTVHNIKTGWKTTFYEGTVDAVLLEPFHGYPQIENWGRGGGGSFSRQLYRFVRGEYRCVRIDDFTAYARYATNPSITTKMPGDDTDIFYFAGSRIPEDQ